MRSRSFLPLVVVAAEVLVYLRYQAFGAEFHFWLHGMVGGTLGLGALATLRLLRPGRRPPSMWAAAGAGHAYAAFPDVLFLGAGLLHVWWMDVFALHVRIHFVPAPLATMFVGFSLALTAAVAVELQARRTAAFAL
ncbi:MAG: hypothetical protein ACRD0F_02960, partial [Acidimicrobiales bacterium]